ncbi:AraC family ligand binding domain-containing protein [Streptomyces sp. ISL-99]|uniref:AraC family ligand binding domain-containing protein n=1 Tax=Streptomyces sp. ISL-99 TaxID=2819193 RepID=UPI0035B016EC
MTPRQEISAWRPPVAGVVEVFHAHFIEHAYPMHVHDAWTLLIVDEGAVRYDLDRHEHGTPHDTVSLLPPQVPHNGAPATPQGFRKRVLYLDMSQLDERFIGPAVDGPDLTDPLLRRRVGQLHTVLGNRGEEFEAESRLALIAERLRKHLRPSPAFGCPAPDRSVARNLRDLLDERLVEGITLDEAARLLHAHPAHLVLLLAGHPPGEVAAAAGFYDHQGRQSLAVVVVPEPGHAVGTGQLLVGQLVEGDGPAGDPGEDGGDVAVVQRLRSKGRATTGCSGGGSAEPLG